MSLTNRPVVHAPPNLLPDWMKAERTKMLNKVTTIKKDGASVIYWMQRDVRTVDNWALLLASHLASSRGIPLRVVYALPPPPPTPTRDDELPPALIDMPMTKRHGSFLLGGLECVHQELSAKNIPLHVIQAGSHDTVGETVCQSMLDHGAQAVVCDFSPLRQFREWMELQAEPILSNAGIPFIQVDAHNVVPVWKASEKREVGARTLRPRIHKVVNDYLQTFPDVKPNTAQLLGLPAFQRNEYETFLNMDESVPVVPWAKPGTEAANTQFQFFVDHGLKKFDQLRNDPNEKNVCSNLSPWINHGHISFQRIVLDVKKLNKYANGTASYIEEGVVRRELSDNYVYYSPNDYDALTAAAGWAQETLQVHSRDPREYVYTLDELETGHTYDDLWNAAQLQVVREGQMHGFLRMYWAKKILEWTESPEVALRTAQYFNDKYALDGKDPNGFVGVGWSIMGIHDMGWKERPVFGKIRFMNYKGCQRKFKVPLFVAKYKGAAENAGKATVKDNHSKKRDISKVSSSSKKQRS